MEAMESRTSRIAAKVYIAYTKHELELIDFLRKKIGSDDRWAMRAFERIYQNQTDDERVSQDTKHNNGIGFSGFDANIMSSMHESLEKYGSLSMKQMAVIKRIMPKYAKQIFNADYCDKEKLEAIYQQSLALGNVTASARSGRVLMASAFSDVGKELSKFELDEYGHFVRVHQNEWMCFPKNRAAEVPVIYVIMSKGKYVAGYAFLDHLESNTNYEGSPQESIAGIIEELAVIKEMLSDEITKAKNRMLDKKIKEDQETQSEGEGGEGEDDDLGGTGGGDDSGGGDDFNFDEK